MVFVVLQRVQIIADPDEGELFIERVPGRHHRQPATLSPVGETRKRLRRGHALRLTVKHRTRHLRAPVVNNRVPGFRLKFAVSSRPRVEAKDG